MPKVIIVADTPFSTVPEAVVVSKTPSSHAASGARITGARPKPATTMPVISPVRPGENHLIEAGVVAQ